MMRLAGSRLPAPVTTSARIRGAGALLMVLAVALLTACGSSAAASSHGTRPPAPRPYTPSSTHVGPFTVLRSSSRSAGTVLTPGLVVPAGSDILGTVFPDATGKGGFLALGLVTGDPVAVFNAYVDQASAMGMTVGDGGGCVPAGAAVSCLRTVSDPGDGEQLSVAVERHPASPGYVSHVALRYAVPGSVDLSRIGPPTAPPPTAPIMAPPLPSLVAVPSDQAWNLSVAPAGPGLQLVGGSVLVGPPGPCGCGGRGWSAVLRVTGDPEAVLAGYAAQLTSAPISPTRRQVGSTAAELADLGLVSAGFTQLRLVSDGDATYLLVAVAQL